MLLVTALGTIFVIGVPGLVGYGSLRARLAATEKDIDKLDANKASKEFADGLKSQIADLKAELDKRFDHLEELLRNNGR